MSGKYPTAPPLGPGPGYPPQQQGPYPTGYPQPQYQTGYPYQQSYGQPMQPPHNPPPYQEAPPPYTSAVPGPPHHSHPAYQTGPPQPVYPQQPQTTVIAPGLYDGGARFDGIAQPRLPPPPPGVAPNAAQLAAMQGHTVIGTQQSTSWLTGNRNDGGYSWGF